MQLNGNHSTYRASAIHFCWPLPLKPEICQRLGRKNKKVPTYQLHQPQLSLQRGLRERKKQGGALRAALLTPSHPHRCRVLYNTAAQPSLQLFQQEAEAASCIGELTRGSSSKPSWEAEFRCSGCTQALLSSGKSQGQSQQASPLRDTPFSTALQAALVLGTVSL